MNAAEGADAKGEESRRRNIVLLTYMMRRFICFNLMYILLNHSCHRDTPRSTGNAAARCRRRASLTRRETCTHSKVGIFPPRAVRTRRQGAAPFSPVRLKHKTAVYNWPPVEATPVARRATVDTPDPQGRAHGRLGRVLGPSLKNVGDVNATVANWNVSFAKHARHVHVRSSA